MKQLKDSVQEQREGGFSTRALHTHLHAGPLRENRSPVYLNSGHFFPSVEEAAKLFSEEKEGFVYGRWDSPNGYEFIRKLCVLEECEDGMATSSGMAAIFSLMLAHFRPGDHFLCTRALFGATVQFFRFLKDHFHIDSTPMESAASVDEWKAAIRKETRMIFVETPSNPQLDIINLQALGEITKSSKLLFVVDNCFATPYLQSPVLWGADIVLHSATKFIDGQGRVLGGAVLGRRELIDPIRKVIQMTGPALSSFNAWILSSGLETLSLRMERHCTNALGLAEFLSEHPKITRVTYPFLPSHPHYLIAQRQMRKGGGMLTFCMKHAQKLVQHLPLFLFTANLGDSRTIITHPASTTHAKLSPTERKALGIEDDLIRVSAGLEDTDDILEQFANAIAVVGD